MIIRPAKETEIDICLAIRRAVFIEGQSVPEAEEVDGKDPICLHYLAFRDQQAIATLRVLPMQDIAKIQRVAVLEAYRGAGVGAAVMRAAMEDLQQRPEFQTAKLGSQTHAIGFYEKLGFEVIGPEYLDAGILHRDMVCALT